MTQEDRKELMDKAATEIELALKMLEEKNRPETAKAALLRALDLLKPQEVEY